MSRGVLFPGDPRYVDMRDGHPGGVVQYVGEKPPTIVREDILILKAKIERLRLEVHVAALEKFMHLLTDSREEIPYIDPVHLTRPL